MFKSLSGNIIISVPFLGTNPSITNVSVALDAYIVASAELAGPHCRPVCTQPQAECAPFCTEDRIMDV